MLLRSTVGFLLGLTLSFSAWATSLELAKTPVFVDPSTISFQAIPAPPAAGSVEEKVDKSILMWEQQRRTFYDYQHAWSSVTLEPSYFGETLDIRFAEARYPLLYGLIKTVLGDTKLYTDAYKAYYKRPRPYHADSKVKPFIPEEENFSYPSGHATRGMTTALVLAQLFPAKRDELLKTGRKIGEDRVIGGVHYPSDINAGVQLSEALAKSIINSPAFKAQVKAAQAEIKEIKAASPGGR